MNNQTKAEKEPAPKEKSNLFNWIDAFIKLIITGIGIFISYLGYSFQREFSQSQLLVQLEKGDTEIRAQMFGKITDRLMKPRNEKDDSVLQDTLLAQVLALNFHELIELKPLMINLEDLLDSKIKGNEKNIRNPDELPSKIEELKLDNKVSKKARSDLVSSAKRIRDRQVSALIHPFRKSADTDKKSGTVQYISILRKGKLDTNRCGVTEPTLKDSGKSKRKNGCLQEFFEIETPSGEYTLALSIDVADWEKERFFVTLSYQGKELIPSSEPSTILTGRNSEKCYEVPYEGDEKQTTATSGYKQFWVTWFDFPFIDNTVLPDGLRYAVYIDTICQEARLNKDANSINEPNAVRLAVLFFPEDYYPSRERPVSSKQIRVKLAHLKEE